MSRQSNYQMMHYWLIDASIFTSTLLFAIYYILNQHYINLFCVFVIFWLYPLLLELLFNTIFLRCEVEQNRRVSTSSRFIYHPNYNISLFGLEKLHPFDCHRYQRVFNLIVQKGLLTHGQQVRPQSMSRVFLLQKMSPTYLKNLCYGFNVAKLVQLDQWWLPGWLLRWRVLDPMLLASQGSIEAAKVALELGWAVNLSGGFHHASFTEGGGFCVYPDISLMVHYLQTRQRIRKIMIVDLDAHQGNGFQKDLILNDDIYIVDCYNSLIFKDTEGEDGITKRLHVHSKTTNEQYLRLIDSIQDDLDFFQPEFLIYNAGTDILDKDPLGQMTISRETVIERDDKMVSMCRQRKVPVAILLSGGYQHLNAEVISQSLANLMNRWRQ